MIQEVDGMFVISSHRVWLPGVYDSRRAARYAFRFKDSDLDALQQSVNPNGVITFEMLRQLRQTPLHPTPATR